MSKKNQNYTNRKQNRFQPERMRGNVFVNNSGKQWLPGENGRAAKVERLLRGAKEEKKEIAGNMAEYKDSGVEWIGAIPKEWSVNRLKNLSAFKTGGTPPRNKGISSDNNGTPWVTPSDITDSLYVNNVEKYISDNTIKNCKYKLYPKNSILLVCIASVGKIALIDKEAYSNQQITALMTYRSYDARFILCALKAAMQKITSESLKTVVPIINTKALREIKIALPPLPEQQRIADFLDTKCDILDRTIDAVSRQIEDLEKYKKALITKTVTKGICKKGKPERAMKNSGVEWIGEVPEEWSVSKVKYNFSTFKKIPGKESEKYERLSLTMNGVKHREKWTAEGLQPKDFMSYQLLRKGDLVFRLIDLQNPSKSRRVALSHDTGLISPAYTILHADNNKMLPEYAEMFFLMMSYLDVFNALGSCGVRSSINNAELMKISVLVPPLAEQQQIADYLDEKCKNIDNRVQKRRQQLEWLKEYKKSLIFDYVTGKKRV
ncbi:hypothetical protein G7B22_24000 [Blautia sp. MSK.20.9]|uniref:restriction endonuclease subunit S n=1 Tax=Blautia sp. MSK20_18 TaxID=2883186 RepID=UPI00156E9085|nr:restriction endonuclease subunit S [Blautia sp. MSK20_18]MCB7508327.1 restriction endonuclease subunit S [Blautia sp. MSK20_18]NSK11483.1 hypothetical protein [Blautia sp. MSK.20.9]